jgi:hypothetical protein
VSIQDTVVWPYGRSCMACKLWGNSNKDFFFTRARYFSFILVFTQLSNSIELSCVSFSMRRHAINSF